MINQFIKVKFLDLNKLMLKNLLIMIQIIIFILFLNIIMIVTILQCQI
jgi:hypothetical protein